MSALYRLMPNVSGLSEDKRHLFAGIVQSVLMNVALSWAFTALVLNVRVGIPYSILRCRNGHRAYTTPLPALRPLPIDLLALEHCETFDASEEALWI